MKLPTYLVYGLAALIIASVAAPAFAADTAAADSSSWSSVASAAWAYIATPAAISGLVGFFTAILPHGEPGTPWGYARMALDFIGSNWGNARNAVKN